MDFRSDQWNITQITRNIGASELVLQPDHQRYYIWSGDTEQGLIDTILRGYPIPPIWLWCHRNDQGRDIWEVIDGQQRLTCITRYKDNVFPFRGAGLPDGDPLRDAAGCFCQPPHPTVADGRSLPTAHSESFWNYRVNYIEVRTEDRSKIIDIFKRLNKTSTNLKPQELLNAFYAGRFKRCIYLVTSQLQEDNYWGGGGRVFKRQTTDRMGTQQFVSELFACMMTGESQHKSDQVEEYYARFDTEFNNEETWKRKFSSTLDLIKELLPGPSRFTKNFTDFYTLFLYLYNLKNEADIRLEMYDNKRVISDTLTDFDLKYTESSERGSASSGEIFEEYRLTIEAASKEKSMRDKRYSIISGLINPGLQRIDLDPNRIFSEDQKRCIWNSSTDKVCEYCNQRVENYHEYEPDHIIPWSHGGKTVVTNGRVFHVTCNRRRQAGEALPQ